MPVAGMIYKLIHVDSPGLAAVVHSMHYDRQPYHCEYANKDPDELAFWEHINPLAQHMPTQCQLASPNCLLMQARFLSDQILTCAISVLLSAASAESSDAEEEGRMLSAAICIL